MRLNAFKDFRKSGDKTVSFDRLESRFDQPTYFSFRIKFGELRDFIYNGGAGQSSILNYDIMPHPLFGFKQDTNVNNRDTYSAINYLLDNNEFTRAKMLEEWIELWNSLQDEFQWYFQKIDGVDELLKVDTKKGVRVTEDKKITVTALEGVDLRMSHLLQMYKKIAWDDKYQRWVLPEMMRYFTLTIYLSEFRTFHKPRNYDSLGRKQFEEEPGELYLNILDDLIPTWTLKCEMCQFDIENMNFTHLSNLSIADEPEMGGVTFDIKIGKVYEEQVYPIFRNKYLIDKQLNGFDRSKEFDNQNEDSEYKSTSIVNPENQRYNGNIQAAQSLPGFGFDVHRSTASYNQLGNSKDMFGANAAGADGTLFSGDDNITSVDPTQPNTWVNNAIDFGKAFLNNEVTSLIDEAKMTKIPGLGVSFTEVKSALESKNVITALGLIRQGIEEVTQEALVPSELLEGTIDNNFRDFLIGVTKSQATSEINQLMQEAANTALNDDGTWEKIKDFSKATDLVGNNTGELNNENPINIETGIITQPRDRSTATDLDGGPNKMTITNIIEAAPSSTATTNQILK